MTTMFKHAYMLFTILFCMISTQAKTQNYFESITINEPSEKFPNGQINPKAPKALKQFDFMLGTCKCTDSILNKDGSYRVYPSLWKAKYFLNGYGIQDNNFNPVNPTSNLRLFDNKTKTWKVTYLQSANGYYTGVWEGKLEDSGDIVLIKDQNGSTSRLVFYNISDTGYNWRAEQISKNGKTLITWQKTCIKENEL